MDLVIWSPSVSHNIIQMIFQTIDFWSNQWKFSIYNDDRWWPILIFSDFHYQNFVIFFWFFVSFLLFQMEQQQKPIANQPIFESKKKTSKLICLFFAIFDNLWPNVFFFNVYRVIIINVIVSWLTFRMIRNQYEKNGGGSLFTFDVFLT